MWYPLSPVGAVIMPRTPCTQFPMALSNSMMVRAPLPADPSRLIFSIPTPVAAWFGHQAKGLWLARQFGACNGGQIVTLLPLTACTRWNAVCPPKLDWLSLSDVHPALRSQTRISPAVG